MSCAITSFNPPLEGASNGEWVKVVAVRVAYSDPAGPFTCTEFLAIGEDLTPKWVNNFIEDHKFPLEIPTPGPGKETMQP